MRISDWSSDVCSSDLLGDDAQMGAVAQQPLLLARLRQREPVDMRLPPFGIVAHLGRPPALAPCVEQPRQRLPLGDVVGLALEQAAAGQEIGRRRLGTECVRTCNTWWSPDQ